MKAMPKQMKSLECNGLHNADVGKCEDGEPVGENYVGLFGTQVRMLEGSSNFMDSAATCHREGGRLNFLATEEEALALRILSGILYPSNHRIKAKG